MRKSERSKISTVGQFWCKRGIYHALHEEIRAQQDIDRRSESKLKGKAEVMVSAFPFFDTCNKINPFQPYIADWLPHLSSFRQARPYASPQLAARIAHSLEGQWIWYQQKEK
jgi:hypothetical protein